MVLESSVQILELLSTPLRRELRYARYESCLKELGFSAMTQQLSLQLHSKTLAAVPDLLVTVDQRAKRERMGKLEFPDEMALQE